MDKVFRDTIKIRVAHGHHRFVYKNLIFLEDVKRVHRIFHFESIEGKIIRTITANRSRQHPIDFGNATTFAITCNEPKLIEIAKRIMSETKYTGLCEIEFKKDQKSGNYMFLEVNSRTWKWHSLCQAANIDLIFPYYEYLISGKSHFEIQKQKDAYFQHNLTDLPTENKNAIKEFKIINPQKVM